MRYPNIDAERARAGLTQEEFARRLNVTRKTVYNWGRAGGIPQEKVELMARMFGVTQEYLLTTAERSE